MQLSKNFTLAEFTASATARRLALPNVPSAAALDRLRTTAQFMEQVRSLLGNRPIIIRSGYRSAAVNRAVGGVPNSDHITGRAVDFTHSTMRPAQVASEIRNSTIPFDQLILYDHHVHISFGRTLRRQYIDTRRRV